MERRLAAILAADVVGYSRLIRADEEGTIAALKGTASGPHLSQDRRAPWAHRQAHGRKMLAEFASVIGAVRAAVEALWRLIGLSLHAALHSRPAVLFGPPR